MTQNFLPELSGIARRDLALVRRYPEPMSVSTVAARDVARFDSAEDYTIERQPFTADRATSLISRIRWERWLTGRCKGRIQVLHAGDIALAGRIAWRVHKRLRIPYFVQVTEGNVGRARDRARKSALGRRGVRLVLGDAAGMIAATEHAAVLTRELMSELGISQPAPVAALGVGTDPAIFGPGRDSGVLRARWGVRRAPIVLTVARLAPHKGQDTGIEALALLRDEFPDLRYVLVGEGSDEARLRNLAADLNVMDRVGFAGPMRDDELPEAYATSTIYLGVSRAALDGSAEHLGLSLVEAAATALPVVASRTEGAGTVVREDRSCLMVDPSSAREVADAIASLLRDSAARNEMGMIGRENVETYLNWNRVANDTAQFVRECVGNG